MEVTLTIPGRLPGLNEFISAQNTNRYKGNLLKHDAQQKVAWCIRQQLRGVSFEKPVHLDFLWVEKNHKRDLDNISSFGRKVIQDALVQCHVLKNDGWRFITGFSDSFATDKTNPRIVVEIREEEENAGTP